MAVPFVFLCGITVGVLTCIGWYTLRYLHTLRAMIQMQTARYEALLRRIERANSESDRNSTHTRRLATAVASLRDHLTDAIGERPGHVPDARTALANLDLTPPRSFDADDEIHEEGVEEAVQIRPAWQRLLEDGEF